MSILYSLCSVLTPTETSFLKARLVISGAEVGLKFTVEADMEAVVKGLAFQ